MSWGHWSFEEDQIILRMRDGEGRTFREIAKTLVRPYYTVYGRYKTLKGVEVSGASLHRTPAKLSPLPTSPED